MSLTLGILDFSQFTGVACQQILTMRGLFHNTLLSKWKNILFSVLTLDIKDTLLAHRIDKLRYWSSTSMNGAMLRNDTVGNPPSTPCLATRTCSQVTNISEQDAKLSESNQRPKKVRSTKPP